MGFFKKPTVQTDNDEDIRREIRARVAKQVGIYDEEYINTGKIGGTNVVETPADSSEPVSVVAAVAGVEVLPAVAIPVITENEQGETELTFEPINTENKPQEVVEKPVKQKAPTKPVKQKASKKKNHNLALILIILVLIFAFIPLYYYLTGVSAL